MQIVINKNHQDQSLNYMWLYLSKFVFCHEQFYVVFSKVTSVKELRDLIFDKDDKYTKYTKNIV